MAPVKGICVRCGEPVTAHERAAYEVRGFEVEREQGGQNHVLDRTRVDGRIWHARFKGDCIDNHLNGGNVQEALC